MNRDELLALADRCGEECAPDRKLDAQIAATLRIGTEHSWAHNFPDWIGRADGRVYLGDNGPSFPATAYTASLDAAMTLVEVDEYWRLGNDGEGPDPADFKATVTSHDGVADMHFHDAVAATPALALCAAALRAKASQ